MDDTAGLPPSVEESEPEKLVDHYIAEMQRLQQQMREDREEILLLQAETSDILDAIMMTLMAA